VPKIYNLRTDTFERTDITSNEYWNWFTYHVPKVNAGTAIVQAFMQAFKDFPPRQKVASFTIEQAHDTMATTGSGD
jgi:hypothetical protein